MDKKKKVEKKVVAKDKVEKVVKVEPAKNVMKYTMAKTEPVKTEPSKIEPKAEPVKAKAKDKVVRNQFGRRTWTQSDAIDQALSIKSKKVEQLMEETKCTKPRVMAHMHWMIEHKLVTRTDDSFALVPEWKQLAAGLNKPQES
jgi:hypothetical protein